MSSGSYYEEEMSSGGHRRLTAFILWPFPLSKISPRSTITMELAGRLRWSFWPPLFCLLTGSGFRAVFPSPPFTVHTMP